MASVTQIQAQQWAQKCFKNCQYFIGKYSPTGMPQEWIAGIIFNECSRLDPKANRFEPSVWAAIQAVKSGKPSTAFPGFNSGRIKAFIAATNDIAQLKALATSYGLGQLMGYHYFMKFGLNPPSFMDLTMEMSVKYLCEFAAIEHQRVIYPGLQVANVNFPPYEQLLRIWNTGSPKGKTYDPNYVANATMVAAEYQKLLKGPANG